MKVATGTVDHGAYENFDKNDQRSLLKTEGFHPEKLRGNVKSRSIGDTCNGLSRHPKNYNFRQILESCFQSRPLEDISLYLFTK